MTIGSSNSTRTFFLLGTLSVHYSLLSIVLHYSRTLGTHYHPSAAIVATELGKIVVSLSLVANGGELRETMKERRKLRDEARFRQLEEEERRLLAEEQRRERERARDWERDQDVGGPNGGDNEAEVPLAGGTKLHQRKSSTSLAAPKNVGLSINVDRAKTFVPQTPSLAVIPATPAPEPSPTGVQEVSLLFPHRPSREPDERRTVGQDLRDGEWWSVVKASVFGRGSSSIAVVAGIYALQNRAQYTAAANLSVPLFQLAYQLKIPATAMCTVVLLNRALSTLQWVALFALTFGVGIVQLCSVLADAASVDSPDGDHPLNQFVGLAAVVFACLSSGCASVAFERILKVPSSNRSPPQSSFASNSPPSCSSPTLPSSTQLPLPDWSSLVPSKPSLWIRNIQLSVFGLIASLPFLVYEAAPLAHLGRASDGFYPGMSVSNQVVEGLGLVVGSLFRGFSSPIVWLVIALQVSGGLLSALVILHADNLLKCFATSLSILLSLVASVLLFNFHITPGITFGAAVVLLATLAYTSPATFQSLITSPLALLLRLTR
ncbi:hypothetical protein JCM11491_000473 [Sporobolomyces phaffii]